MTHPAYLLARLHARSARFEVGTGGIPELTDQDIAAALRWVPAGIGYDLLCLAWMDQDRIETRARLLSTLAGLILTEWSARESAMLDAMLAIAQSRGGPTLRRARDMYDAAHSARWPSITTVEMYERGPHEPYSAMPAAVVEEIIYPRHCPECEGRAEVRTRFGKRACTRCSQTGVVATGNTDRAKSLGIKEHQYRKTWDRPYTWLLERCTDELRRAGKALEAAAA